MQNKKSFLQKIISTGILAILILLSIPVYAFASPDIQAPSGILIDSKTGQVLWSKNADQQRPMASTTKIMTGILALENASLSDMATISKAASEAGETELYLEAGENISVEHLLYATMLKSANDAATALAEKIGGNYGEFINMMNDKARKLEMTNTNFTNPHGLHNERHFSTASDMAKLARYVMQNEAFRKIVVTKEVSIPWPGHEYQRVAKNHNRLVEQYPLATGIKTGYTVKAGYCLVGSAQLDGREAIVVVLGGSSAQSVADQAKTLLDWGLKNFESKEVVSKGKKYADLKVSESEKIPLTAESSLDILTAKDEKNYAVYVIPDKDIGPPILAGQIVGRIEVHANNMSLGKVDLIAEKSSSVPGLSKGVDFIKKLVKSFTDLLMFKKR